MKKLYTLMLVISLAIGAYAQPCDAIVQASPAHDTICNEDITSITLSGPEVPADTLRFRYTVEIPPGVTVTSGTGSNLLPEHIITDQIVNTTNSAQLVLF